jgi:hypothetical protein
MSDLYNQIVRQRGSVENLLVRIPGFRGYIEKASRRTADRMLRDFIAARLKDSVNRLAQIERALLDAGGLGYMSRTQSAKTKLQTFHDRVKAAAPGYSGFMEAVKVEEEQLEALYAFDEAMVRYAEQIEAALTALQRAVSEQADVQGAIAELDRITIEANEAFGLRDDVLTNISRSLNGD